MTILAQKGCRNGEDKKRGDVEDNNSNLDDNSCLKWSKGLLKKPKKHTVEDDNSNLDDNSGVKWS